MKYVLMVLALFSTNSVLAEGGYTAKNDPFMQACRTFKDEDKSLEPVIEKVCFCAETGYVYHAAFQIGKKPRTEAEVEAKKEAALKKLEKMSIEQRLENPDLLAEIGTCIKQSKSPEFKTQEWSYK